MRVRVPYASLRWLGHRNILFLAFGWAPLFSWPIWALARAEDAWLGLFFHALAIVGAYLVSRSRTAHTALLRVLILHALPQIHWPAHVGYALPLGAVLVGLTLKLVSILFFGVWDWLPVRYAFRAPERDSAESQDKLIVFASVLYLAKCGVGLAMMRAVPVPGYEISWSRLIDVPAIGVILALIWGVFRLRARARWLRRVADGNEARWRIIAIDDVPEEQRRAIPSMSAASDANAVLVRVDAEDAAAHYRDAPVQAFAARVMSP
jgi:hypothetical protein